MAITKYGAGAQIQIPKKKGKVGTGTNLPSVTNNYL